MYVYTYTHIYLYMLVICIYYVYIYICNIYIYICIYLKISVGHIFVHAGPRQPFAGARGGRRPPRARDREIGSRVS